jgi:hypothetical protein
VMWAEEINVLINKSECGVNLEFRFVFFWVNPGQPIWPVTRSLDRVNDRVGFQNYAIKLWLKLSSNTTFMFSYLWMFYKSPCFNITNSRSSVFLRWELMRHKPWLRKFINYGKSKPSCLMILQRQRGVQV